MMLTQKKNNMKWKGMGMDDNMTRKKNKYKVGVIDESLLTGGDV